MDIFREHAPILLEYGLPVIPLRGKIPRPGEWSRFCEVLPEEKLVEHWCKEFPNSNIGLCCGPLSGVIGLDVDVEDKKLVSLIKSIFPASPVEKRSKKGWTWFYKYSGERKSQIRFMGYSIIDVLGAGSQCMIPPSIHPDTGKHVTWLGAPLHEMLDELQPLPSDIYAEFQKALNSLDRAVQITSVPSGRNDTMKGIVTAMYTRGEKIDEIVKEVIEHDRNWFGVNPLFADSSEFSGSGDSYINAVGFCANIIKTIGKARIASGKRSRIVTTADAQDNESWPNADSGFFNAGRPQYDEFADYMIKKRHFKCTDGVSYIYDNGKYSVISQLGIDNLIRVQTKKKSRANQIPNFKKVLLADSYQADDVFNTDDLAGFLNLANGTLNIKTKKLTGHSPKNFFLYKLEHPYLPDAKCERWLEYLEFVFEGRRDLIELSAEVFGYCIAGGKPWLHKAFCLLGKGRNGKSTWLTALQGLIGVKNFSSVPMESISLPFSVVGLQGKLCNIRDESPKKIIDSEAFKTIVGGSYVRASFKGRDEFEFKPIARLFFSANEVPKFRDESTGLLERLYFIPFNRYIPEESRIDKDDELASEMSGILNWAIGGLDRLMVRGRFVDTEMTKVAMDEFRAGDDSIYYWFKNYIRFDKSADRLFTPAALYDYYKFDVKNDGKIPKNKDAFYKGFTSLVSDDYRTRSNDKRYYTKILYKEDSIIP